MELIRLFFNTGLWLIPVVLLGTLGGLYVLMRYWQNRTSQALKPVLPELRSLQTSLRRLTAAARDHTPQDPEPYGSYAGFFLRKVGAADQQTETLGRHYAAMQERLSRLKANPWQAILGAVFLWYPWYRAWQEVASLEGEIAAGREAASAAEEALQKIERLPWEVALQARQVVSAESEVRHTLEDLRGVNMRGAAIEAAEKEEGELDLALGQLPLYFLNSNEPEVFDQGDKPSTIQAYALLAKSGPAVQRLLAQVRAWQGRHQETTAKLANLRQALGEVDQLLGDMPPNLNTDDHAARLQPLSQTSESLHAALANLEVESIPQVHQKAEEVRMAAQEISSQLKQSRRQLVALERSLADLSDRQALLSAQIAALGKSPVHPLIWNKSRGQLTEISRKSTAIGPLQKPRTPEVIAADLASTNSLLALARDLAAQVQEVTRQHAELLGLLSGPEIQAGLGWCQEAQKLAAQVITYDPENWAKADSVSGLAPDVHELTNRHQALAAQDKSAPLQETDLPGRLEQVRTLVALHKAVSERAGRIRTRLAELTSLETVAHERVQEARNTLTQVALLANSNDSLAAFAGQEQEHLRNEVEQLNTALGQRKKGPVGEKADRAALVARKVEQVLNTWLDQLNQEIENRKKELAGRLEVLKEMANLDERAIHQAGELLSQDLAVTAVPRSKHKALYPLGEIIGALKARSDYWQRVTANLREVDELEKQIADTHSRALEQYRQTRDLLDAGLQQIPEKHGWPPTSLNLQNEHIEFDNIELDWQKMEQQPGRALWVVSQLSDFYSRCQMVAERTRQLTIRAQQEQNRVNELLSDLEEVSRLWQAQVQFFPAASNEIHRLLGNMSNQVDNIKRLWLQGSSSRPGSMTYSEVVQQLSSVVRDTQNYRIMLEDTDGRTQEIGIYGAIRANRWR